MMLRHLTVLGILMFSAALAAAQPTAEPLRFEAASVKLIPEPVRPRAGRAVNPGRITYPGVTLYGLVTMAFALQRQLLDIPETSNFEFYDVEATMPPGTTLAQRRLMLQTLLTERWGMQFHRVTELRKAFVVTVAPGGIKMREGKRAYNESTSSSVGPTGETFRGTVTVESLLRMVGISLDAPMVDRTGLTAEYKITLHWIPDPGPPSRVAGAEPGTLLREMEKQLGLHVETAMMPIEKVIIDHLDRVPTKN
jgi:uncharacterized protein (TIGR03435 family)